MPFKIMRQKQRFFCILMISYLTILSLPIFFGCIFYKNLIQVVLDHSFKTHLNMLEKCRDILDTKMKEIDLMTTQLILSPKINSLLYIDNPLAYSNICEVRDSWLDLSKKYLPNYLIVQLYIYFDSGNIILSPQTSYVRLYFFNNDFFTYQGMTFLEWRNKELGRYFKKAYFPASPVTFSGKESSVITCIRSFPICNQAHRKAHIIVFLDESKILQIFHSMKFIQGGCFYITDEKGSLLTVFSSKFNLALPLAIPSPEMRGFFEQKISGETMAIFHTTSLYNRWKLVEVVPSRLIMTKVEYIKRIFWPAMALIVLVSVIIAVMFAFRNSKPIRELIRNIKGRMSSEQAHISNEYDFLSRTFATMEDRNKDLTETLWKQAPVIRGVLVDRLLKGEFITNEEINSILSACTGMKESKFLVLLIHIKGYNGPLSKKSLDALNLSRSKVRTLFEKELNCDGRLRDVDLDKIALLLSFDSTKSNQNCRKEVGGLSKNLKTICFEDYSIRLSFSAGSIVDNVLNVCISYMEAKKALNYASLEKEMDDSIIWYSMIPKDSKIYYYPMDIEYRIMTLVKAGDFESVDKLLMNIYRNNFDERRLSLQMADELIHEMNGTIMKLHVEISYEKGTGDSKKLPVTEALNNSSDIDEILESIRKTYQFLCATVNEHKKSHNIKLKEAIVSYINSLYSDPNLCLCAVSSKFGINEIYLSQFFKEQTGENFHHYLEKLRMSRASALISGTDLSINEIAKKIGYYNANSFRKAFRRIEGESPKAYRLKIKTAQIPSISQDS